MKKFFLLPFLFIVLTTVGQVDCANDTLAPIVDFVTKANGTSDSLGLVVYAIDLVHSAADNCTPYNKLLYTFDGVYPSSDNLDKVHYFNKDGNIASLEDYELGLAQKWHPANLSSSINLNICKNTLNFLPLYVTVWDEKKNVTTGTTKFNLYVKGNVDCKLIKVFAAKANGQSIKNFNVIFNANLAEFPLFFINVDSLLVTKFYIDSTTYCVKLTKTDRLLNGITTKDLIAIQSHILGVKKLDTPYKLIAADVNSDGKITSSDLLLARKILLGIVNKIDSDPWIFINKQYVFSNPLNPFKEKDKWQSNNCFYYDKNSNVSLDFIGIKLGDVDESATP